MIIDSMTYQEKREEFKRDFNANVHPAYLHCFGREKLYERIARKLPNDKRYHFTPIEYESKGQNHWMFFYGVNGKNGFKKQGFICTEVLLYRTHDGKIAAMTLGDNGMATFWEQHFFERYRERGLKDMTLSIKDSLIKFFMTLGYVNSQGVDSKKHRNNIYALLDMGLMLGEVIPDDEMMIHYHTFISNEMLKEGQYEDYASLLSQSYEDSQNFKRPEYIKRYEKNFKNSLLFYGKPIVLKGCNDDYYSFFTAKRFATHEEAVKTFLTYRLPYNFTIEREMERHNIWENYIKNQRKKGNTNQMCLAPMVYNAPCGLEFLIYKMTSYHSSFEQMVIASPYRTDDDVYMIFKVEHQSNPLLTFTFKLSAVESFIKLKDELKGWSEVEAFFPLVEFLNISEIYIGEDERILVDSSYGQFSCHQVADNCLCFEELNKEKKYKRLNSPEKQFSWI